MLITKNHFISYKGDSPDSSQSLVRLVIAPPPYCCPASAPSSAPAGPVAMYY